MRLQNNAMHLNPFRVLVVLMHVLLLGSTGVGTVDAEDTGTDTPVLTYPLTNGIVVNPIAIYYSLPEKALAGSVKLQFQNANTTVVLTLQGAWEEAGTHSFAFDSGNPLGSLAVAAGAPIPQGVYDVTLSYQDLQGHVPESATATHVALNPPLQTMELDAGTLAYFENDSTALSPGALVSGDFWNGTTISVRVTGNASVDDMLSVSTATGLTVSGTSVLDGETVIGIV